MYCVYSVQVAHVITNYKNMYDGNSILSYSAQLHINTKNAKAKNISKETDVKPGKELQYVINPQNLAVSSEFVFYLLKCLNIPFYKSFFN